MNTAGCSCLSPKSPWGSHVGFQEGAFLGPLNVPLGLLVKVV